MAGSEVHKHMVERRGFQAEGTVYAKALRLGQVCLGNRENG